MTGALAVLACGGDPVASAPKITGFTIGWSAAKDQFTVSSSGGTFPGNMTVSVTGGTPPYTYFVFLQNQTGMSIDSSSSPNTTVTYSGLAVTGQQDTGDINCIVTDSNGMSRTASTDMGGYLHLTMTRG